MSVDDVDVYHNGIKWTPFSIVGNSKYYTVASDGQFYVRMTNGSNLLSFSVVYPFDFQIEGIYGYNVAAQNTPGSLLVEGSYLQLESVPQSRVENYWVKSTGAAIADLELSASNNAVVQKLTKDAGYGSEWVHLTVTKDSADPSHPTEIYVGNVMSIFIARLT